ncbi:MAG TPA: site-2 protease family protein [Candidatus Hydrogenedentes bacterium]|nr:site-2 protease family protein [Candidatus Hydrogenedentota bacterium]
MLLFDILIFIVVLGILVFFHELGHFLAAKACNVYVDRFSLGMPPRVAGIRIGETDYCVGALPLGGYVKMAGQEDTPLTDEERENTYGGVPRERWFNNRPVWQRTIIIAAGPFMNLVLAVLLYGIVAAVGAYVPLSDTEARIGPILPGSPAETAPLFRMPTDGSAPNLDREPDAVGWQTSDRILTINGKRVRTIEDVGIDAILGAGELMSIVIERTEPDGTLVRYLSPLRPVPMGPEKRLRFGVGAYETALVGSVNEGSPAAAAGLRPGDVIRRANGKPVDAATFVKTMEQTPDGQNVMLEVEREGKMIQVVTTPHTVGRFLGLEYGSSYRGRGAVDKQARPVIVHVSDEFAAKAPVKPRDIIETIEGQPATLALLDEIERSRPGQTVNVTIRRPAILYGLLRPESSLACALPISSVRAVGIQMDVKMIYHRVNPGEVVPEAFKLTWQATARTLRTIEMLVTGAVSPKELGGPVMIYQVTTMAARLGYSWLLNITAFISVNLCIFNLLPLPVLDGSLLVYLAIEAIRRKPLNTRVLERIQQIGLMLIVGLLLYVTFNDVSRLVANLVL